jgi:hypothetical protein
MTKSTSPDYSTSYATDTASTDLDEAARSPHELQVAQLDGDEDPGNSNPTGCGTPSTPTCPMA